MISITSQVLIVGKPIKLWLLALLMRGCRSLALLWALASAFSDGCFTTAANNLKGHPMKTHHGAALAAALTLAALAAGCVTFGRYTGDEYYYTKDDGVLWSCREPKPYAGGNCRPESDWPKPGLNR